jgi:hypothetical protein
MRLGMRLPHTGGLVQASPGGRDKAVGFRTDSHSIKESCSWDITRTKNRVMGNCGQP